MTTANSCPANLDRSARRANVPRFLAVGVLAALALVAAPSELYANQVYKACGSKWLRKAKKLEASQKVWLMEKRSAEAAVDLDGDGRDDVIKMTSNPSFRDCDIRRNWNLKETTIRIELATGKTKLFYWINGILVEKMTILKTEGRILVSGVNAEGSSVSKWIDYRNGSEPPLPTLVAEAGVSEATELDRVAGLTPRAVAQTAAVYEP
ncbi:MAG: hypothetical protein GY719_04960 [bacterium]|nr:hypothetical protein [bacterium]